MSAIFKLNDVDLENVAGGWLYNYTFGLKCNKCGHEFSEAMNGESTSLDSFLAANGFWKICRDVHMKYGVIKRVDCPNCHCVPFKNLELIYYRCTDEANGKFTECSIESLSITEKFMIQPLPKPAPFPCTIL